MIDVPIDEPQRCTCTRVSWCSLHDVLTPRRRAARGPVERAPREPIDEPAPAAAAEPPGLVKEQRYCEYCGPKALAAVTGAPPADAAMALQAVALREGWALDGKHTPTALLAAALLEAGMILEEWSTEPGGWRRGPVTIETRAQRDEIEAILRTACEINSRYREALSESDSRLLEELVTARRPRRELGSLAIDQDLATVRRRRRERRELDTLAVDQWLARFPRGTWVLCVLEHVLVARDGRIVAGDDAERRYRFHALRNAWRVVPCR